MTNPKELVGNWLTFNVLAILLLSLFAFFVIRFAKKTDACTALGGIYIEGICLKREAVLNDE